MSNPTASAVSASSLTDRAGDRAKEYSGGMQRRLNIGIGLLHEPQLLILDEPTVGVDPQSRNHIFESVQQLNRDRGMSIVYTSHYMEEVELLCDRVAIVDQGKVIAEGPPEHIASNPAVIDAYLGKHHGEIP